MCIGNSICIDNVCTCPIGQYVFDSQCIPQIPQLPTLAPTVPPSNIPVARPSEACDVNTVCIGGSSCILGVCQCPPGYIPSPDLSSCMNNLLVNSGGFPQQRSYPGIPCNQTVDCPKNMFCNQQICKCLDGFTFQDGACLISGDQPRSYPVASKSDDDEIFETIMSNGYPGTRCSPNLECIQGSSCFLQHDGKQFCACPNQTITNSTGHCTIRLLSDTKESESLRILRIL